MLSGIWSWRWSVEALPREGSCLLTTLALSGFSSLLDEAIGFPSASGRVPQSPKLTSLGDSGNQAGEVTTLEE